ncbi:glycosyltransferase [Kibdelosporangium philippinense]|uniref:glycosyltransferase n=1 Tax=Kibdelosporangium philippinense TaxID=211113 RepID=UPI0036126311
MRTPRPSSATATEQSCFWLVVPALNEELVIARTVRSLLALEAADVRLRVLVVDDGSTDGTSTALAAIDDERLVVLRREPPDARKGKGPALNAAYRLIREVARREGAIDRTVIGVIDADGRASSGILSEVSRYLADPAVGAVQCRVRIRNRHTRLGLLQDVEFGCIADSAQVLRDAIGSVGLGGNGQFTKLSALMLFGDSPWSSCLVEDVELGLRLHRAGIRIRYVRQANVSQQAVVDVRRLVRQRGRWAQGNLQCLRHVPGLLGSQRVTSLGLLDFLHYLITPWLVPPVSVVALILLGLSVYGQFGGLVPTPLVASEADMPVSLALGVTALLLPGAIWGLAHWLRLRDEPLGRCLLISLSYPVFLLLGAAGSCQGIVRHLARRHDWAKTERLAEEA